MRNRLTSLLLAAAAAPALFLATACDKHDPKVVWGEEAVTAAKKEKEKAAAAEKKARPGETAPAAAQPAEPPADVPKFFR